MLWFQNALEGREFVTLSNKLCDIRDGARAHILSAEHEDAEVRYLLMAFLMEG